MIKNKSYVKIIHLQCLIQDLNLGSGMNIVTFKRVMNLVNDLRDIAIETQSVTNPIGVQKQWPCKPMPKIVSNGLETCIFGYLLTCCSSAILD